MSKDHLKQTFSGMINAISEDPSMAKASMLATVELAEGVKCLANVRDFLLTIDEPAEMGGKNEGMNPVELVLAAMGACQEIGYAFASAVMGIPLKKVKCSLEGNMDLRGLLALDESIPAGYTDISYETTIESDADDETLKKLAAFVEKHCPVLDTIKRPVPVKGKIIARRKGKKTIISE